MPDEISREKYKQHSGNKEKTVVNIGSKCILISLVMFSVFCSMRTLKDFCGMNRTVLGEGF